MISSLQQIMEFGACYTVVHIESVYTLPVGLISGRDPHIIIIDSATTHKRNMFATLCFAVIP